MDAIQRKRKDAQVVEWDTCNARDIKRKTYKFIDFMFHKSGKNDPKNFRSIKVKGAWLGLATTAKESNLWLIF